MADRLAFDLDGEERRLFLDEARDGVAAIEAGLLALEGGGTDRAIVDAVFRAAHTLKGSAATIGHRRLAELTHALEDVFGALRDGTLPDLAPISELLFGTVDLLRLLVEEVEAGVPLTDRDGQVTAALREALAALVGSAVPPDAVADRRTGERGAGVRGPVGGSLPESGETGAGARVAGASGLPEPIAAAIGAARAAGQTVTLVRCRADRASPWRGVRLLQAYLAARDGGALRAVVPEEAVLEAGAGGEELHLLLDGSVEAHDSLLQLLRSIDEVAVEVVDLPGVTAGETDRRVVDLGPAARGLDLPGRLAVAGDRLQTANQTIRIDVGRLDELMDLVGELVVHKTRLQRHAAQLGLRLGDDSLAREAEEEARQFTRIAGQLQDRVMSLRMLPAQVVFGRFPRLVRDLAAALGKEVDLVVEGREVELDRSVLEAVADPLGHLVRNALDHGLEPPEERLAAGKPRRGRLRLAARQAEGAIVLTVEDDGRGMDPARLRRAAVERGILAPAVAETMRDAEALQLIFAPGFSTATRVTDVSGRGVGMDAVRTAVESLGGRVEVDSRPGAGTRIELWLPLTLAIVAAMLVRAGGRVCALPLSGVATVLRVERAHLGSIGGEPVVRVRGAVVPVVALDTALGDPPRSLPTDSRGALRLVVVRSGANQVALAVEELLGQQEIVVKGLSVFRRRLEGISGGTILGDGRVALVVDIPGLLQRLLGGTPGAAGEDRRLALDPREGEGGSGPASAGVAA
jgi:two-component system chemotaxis sensor kinase CheA